jgi:hypothetical protein
MIDLVVVVVMCDSGGDGMRCRCGGGVTQATTTTISTGTNIWNSGVLIPNSTHIIPKITTRLNGATLLGSSRWIFVPVAAVASQVVGHGRGGGGTAANVILLRIIGLSH